MFQKNGNLSVKNAELYVNALTDGKLLLLPTDTIWGISCDATNAKAINQIKELKQRPGDKSFIILISDEEMLADYLEESPPSAGLKLLNQNKRPTTVIFPNIKGISQHALANDGSLGIRIPQVQWLQQLIRAFGKPIVSTSANISGSPSPTTFQDIDESIITGVDFILPKNLEAKNVAPSRIVKLNGDTIQVIRE